MPAVIADFVSFRKKDLEDSDGHMWVEVPMKDKVNIVIGNYYFLPGFNTPQFLHYFNILETKLDASRYRHLLSSLGS